MILQPTIIGEKLPTLTNPGSAADLLTGKQLIDADGNVLTGTMPTQGAQTITPGTTAKTIAAGRYLTGAQTIQGDADLIAANIKSGVNIFGVSGTYGAFKRLLLYMNSRTNSSISFVPNGTTANLPSREKIACIEIHTNASSITLGLSANYSVMSMCFMKNSDGMLLVNAIQVLYKDDTGVMAYADRGLPTSYFTVSVGSSLDITITNPYNGHYFYFTYGYYYANIVYIE